MSRTKHAERKKKLGVGKEYWSSRLHKGGELTGRYTKKRTHKKERQEGKIQASLKSA